MVIKLSLERLRGGEHFQTGKATDPAVRWAWAPMGA